MKPNGYRDRAMRARDPRFGLIFDKLRYARRDLVAAARAAEPGPAPELPLSPAPPPKAKKPAVQPDEA